MLNPFKLLAIYGDLNKIAKQAKEMTMQNWKTTLFGALAAGLLAVGNYNGANTWQGYAAAIAVALLGALAKDFNVQLSADEIAAIKNAITGLKVLICVIALGALCGLSMRAQTPAAPVAATPASPSPFTVGSDAVSFQLNGVTAVGTDISESLPFVQSKNYGLFTLAEHNFLAPALKLSGFYGGAQWTPNLSSLIAKTLIPANTFQPFVEFGTGVVSNGVKDHSSTFIGVGSFYDPTGQGHFGIPVRVSYLNAPGFGRSPNGWRLSAGLKWSF